VLKGRRDTQITEKKRSRFCQIIYAFVCDMFVHSAQDCLFACGWQCAGVELSYGFCPYQGSPAGLEFKAGLETAFNFRNKSLNCLRN